MAIYQLTLLTTLPNGVNAIPINLKCCNPNGRPIIVIDSSMPNRRCVSAIQKPPITIHIIFITVDRQPTSTGSFTTSCPNGIRANIPILKHCSPNGIPMMVRQRAKPAVKYSSATNTPPKMNQTILPKQLIYKSFINQIIISTLDV